MKDNNKPKIRFKRYNEDWEQHKLNDYISLKMGHLFSPNDYVQNGRYDVITIVNVKGDRLVDKTDVNTIDVLPNNINDYQILKDGDMLISLTGNIGRVSYNYGNNSILNYRVGKIDFNKIKINDKFVYSYLSKDSVLNELIQKGQGGAQPNISKPELENLPIKVTTNYDEQEDIGDFFEKIDKLIILNQKKLDKFVSIKKALLEKMFPQNGETKPQIRFKGFTDDWEQHKFEDHILSIRTGTNMLGKSNSDGIPLIKMGNLQRGYFSFDKLEYIDDKEKIEKEHFINFGDFLFNTRNTLDLVGKGATWTGISGKYAFNNNIARFEFRDTNTIFYNYLYNTTSVINQVHSCATGTTSVAAVYPRDLKTIEYYMPNVKEQEKIGGLLLSIDNLITLHQSKLDKLNSIKKALLKDMFV